MFAERSISSIDIKIVIIFFLFTKIPRKPIEKRMLIILKSERVAYDTNLIL